MLVMQLIRPIVRAIDWIPLAVAGTLAVMMASLVEAGSALSVGTAFTLLRMMGVMLGAAAGFAVIDEMAASTGAAPVSRRLLQWLRCGLGGLTAGLSWGTACAIAAARLPQGGQLKVAGMAAEAAVCVAIGLLTASAAGRAHHGRAAALAGMGGLLVIASVSLVLRGPYWPWLYPDEENWEVVHYGWLAVLPLVLAALHRANRDLR
ncbi:hypothetical protein [Bailinhaonella thermotolerans]|uniref:Uncharacterized protein n=1 Tax=Bailinhaonella thermotolerans TaxID=1070861 RepID=A0A3A4AXY2_9ACTN|nr:hypothetical protein [Bailinhaonella thermotolerans]RJL35522.1 hypothetical protein D5H75_01585 [Bailinhaonella thermotolerans]